MLCLLGIVASMVISLSLLIDNKDDLKQTQASVWPATPQTELDIALPKGKKPGGGLQTTPSFQEVDLAPPPEHADQSIPIATDQSLNPAYPRTPVSDWLLQRERRMRSGIPVGYLDREMHLYAMKNFRLIADSPEDPTWGRPMEQLIRSRFAAEVLPEYERNIISLECRAAGCDLQLSVTFGASSGGVSAMHGFLRRLRENSSSSELDGVSVVHSDIHLINGQHVQWITLRRERKETPL